MSIWLDYLDSLDERDRMSYDGCCGCYNCQRIRNDFKAYELANTACSGLPEGSGELGMVVYVDNIGLQKESR